MGDEHGWEQYLAQVGARNGGPMSAVKVKILRSLWADGAQPARWVRSSVLLAETGQKYFDRRIRELRDELGCDIESGWDGGEAAYRLNSRELSVGNPRGYLTNLEKRRLFAVAGFTCGVCGRVFLPQERGLQADHRVPLIRGGGHDVSNWQALCVECNVGKRRACQGCQLVCSTCPWAFPERADTGRPVRIPQALAEAVLDYAQREGVSEGEAIRLALEAWFQDRAGR